MNKPNHHQSLYFLFALSNSLFPTLIYFLQICSLELAESFYKDWEEQNTLVNIIMLQIKSLDQKLFVFVDNLKRPWLQNPSFLLGLSACAKNITKEIRISVFLKEPQWAMSLWWKEIYIKVTHKIAVSAGQKQSNSNNFIWFN